jgi:phosphatidylinositol alpha-1,6-mannosyltransferase
MDTLLRASVQLRSTFPDLHVALGGAGRDRSRLERLARRLDAPVTFLGRVPDERLSEWLGASDLMVMDCRSRWLGLEQEGFGIVFVEAAASGVAQVAGRSGGSHEAVLDGVTGEVVENSRSARALAAAMKSLLINPDRRHEYAHNARVLATTRFEWDILAGTLARELTAFDHFVDAHPLP